MFSPSESKLQENLLFLADNYKNLYNVITKLMPQLEGWREESSYNDYIFYGSSLSSLPLNKEILPRLVYQYTNPRIISLPRLVSSQEKATANDIVNMLRESDFYVLSPCLLADLEIKTDEEPPKKIDSAILIGSLSLVLLAEKELMADYINYPSSIFLCESNVEEFIAMLSIVDFSKFISLCQNLNVKFSLSFAENLDEHKDKIYEFLANTRPTSLASTSVLYSGYQSVLEELRTYCFDNGGLGERIFGALGTSTDEYNQWYQALCNTNIQDRKLLVEVPTDSSRHACIVASGPSVDDQIEKIKEIQSLNIPVFAAGSAAAVLLRNGINPNYIVLLERSVEVIADIKELILEGFNINEIPLIYAQNVHPNVIKLFNNSYAYHRPLSSSTPLFAHEEHSILRHAGPLSANAALDIVCHQGYGNIILFGCDFCANKNSQRSKYAVGAGDREFTIVAASNSQTTVYTSPQLSLARDVFNATLILYPHVTIHRYGEGLPLIREKNDIYSFPLQARTSSTNSCDINYTSSNIDIKAFLSSLQSLKPECDRYFLTLKQAIQDADSWKDINHEAIRDCLSLDKSTNLAKEWQSILRLNRQVLLLLLVHLFDASGTSIYTTRKELLLKALDKQNKVCSTWIEESIFNVQFNLR